MDLEHLASLSFTTLDSQPVVGRDLLRRRTVMMLIDAWRTRPDRSSAEIAWVLERLKPSIDLVVVWPRGAHAQAEAIDAVDRARMVMDAEGDFRRLISPTGRRVAILVDLEQGALEYLSATSDVFAVGPGDGSGDRGNDRTLDLGDVYR